jgi:hypothetical protein
MMGGKPAFPAPRVLGTRTSRSHGGRNVLLGNAASWRARKKPTPLSAGRSGEVLIPQVLTDALYQQVLREVFPNLTLPRTR